MLPDLFKGPCKTDGAVINVVIPEDQHYLVEGGAVALPIGRFRRVACVCV